jgi:hypothetical protein
MMKHAARHSLTTLLLALFASAAVHSAPANEKDNKTVKEVTVVSPDVDGALVLSLNAVNFRTDAPEGTPKVMSNGQRTIAWSEPQDWIFWKIKIPAKGTYKVTVTHCSPRDGREILIGISAEQTIAFNPKMSDSWGDAKTSEAGKLTFDKEGEFELSIRPKDVKNWHGLDIYKVVLKKTE